jgi:hypothetical protein
MPQILGATSLLIYIVTKSLVLNRTQALLIQPEARILPSHRSDRFLSRNGNGQPENSGRGRKPWNVAEGAGNGIRMGIIVGLIRLVREWGLGESRELREYLYVSLEAVGHDALLL